MIYRIWQCTRRQTLWVEKVTHLGDFGKDMDAIIFGTFFGLAAIAAVTNYLSKKTEGQKQSVSNSNFIAFQRSFFTVYFLALIGDWLQGPYVYKLYEFYGFREDEV